MKVQNMIGCKLFKDNGDSINLIRITNVKQYKDHGIPSEITVVDEATNETKKVRVDSLKEYHLLEPDGYLTFSIVNVADEKDVVVTASKILTIKLGDSTPYAVCRQSALDIFAGMYVETQVAGLALNKDDCPSNFNFGNMLLCDNIEYTTHFNIYRNDTLDNIIKYIKTKKFDEVLKLNFENHCKSAHRPEKLFVHKDDGWCDSLKLLLVDNNFQNDINEMLGITGVDFEIAPYLVEKKSPSGEAYTSSSDDLKKWLSITFNINIKEIDFIEFNHDINLADFNDSRYLLLRDNKDKLYLAVYILDGEFLEADLIEENSKLDFSDKFRLDFYNKYNNLK